MENPRPRMDSVTDFMNAHITRPRNDSLSTELLIIQPKRARGGSISGRLRAASDLADFGLIDAAQKGTIKVSIYACIKLHFIILK